MLWRETFAQHFATKDGLYEPRKGPKMACRALAAAEHTRNPEPRKPASLARVAKVLRGHVEVLDAFALTKERHDNHPTSRDCTHYCIRERNPTRGVAGSVAGSVDGSVGVWLGAHFWN